MSGTQSAQQHSNGTVGDSPNSSRDGDEGPVLVEVLSETTPKDQIRTIRELLSSISEAVRLLRDEEMELDQQERTEILSGVSKELERVERASLKLLECKHRLRLSESMLRGDELHHSVPMMILIERTTHHVSTAVASGFASVTALSSGSRTGRVVTGPVVNVFLQAISSVMSTLHRLETTIDEANDELSE